MEKNIVSIDNGYLFECPHCNSQIYVNNNEINCRIFRHGQLKNTYHVRIKKTGVIHNSVVIKGGNVGETVKFTNHVTGEKSECVILSINKGGQIPPHSSKIVCDELFNNGLIWGCGKPFQISENIEYVTKCNYI